MGDNQLAFYGTGAVGNWDIKLGDLAVDGSQNGLLYNNFNTGSVTIDSNMIVNTTRPTDRYNIFDSTGYTGNNTFNGPGGVINLNGNITFTGALDANGDNANRSLIIGSTTNNTVINLNGVFTDASASGGPALEIRFGEGGGDHMNYNVNGNVSGMTRGLSIGEGNVNIGSSAVLGTHSIYIYNDQGVSGQNSALYGTQGVTISNNVYLSAKYDFGDGSTSRYGFATEGVSDMSSVTFSGGTPMDSTSLIVNAVAGGRATFTNTNVPISDPNNIYSGSIYGAAPAGLTKTGAGTVVFATFNTYNLFADGRDNATPGTVAMDIKAGTLLANNRASAGSAFGNNSGSVNIEAGATLGGSGSTGATQMTIAEAHSSVIAPGDSVHTDFGTNQIATLTLNGGLTTTGVNGLTMDFKLNGDSATPVAGVNNDLLTVGDMTLNGLVTINLTALDALTTGTPYTLINGAGNWTGTPVFDINTPAGYILDPTYGTAGYDYEANGNTFSIQLEATPEPSTYALMGLGLVSLLALGRFRRLSA